MLNVLWIVTGRIWVVGPELIGGRDGDHNHWPLADYLKMIPLALRLAARRS